MKQYNAIQQAPYGKRVVVLGNFDGIHLGHRELLYLGKKLAKEKEEPLMVFTFYPQWQAVFSAEFKYIVSQEKKQEIFQDMGVDELLSIPFEEHIAKVSPESFVEDILLTKLGVSDIVIGYNYTFGYKGAGDCALLKQLAEKKGAAVHIVPSYTDLGEVVSSTLIRKYFQNGDILRANHLLGYPLSFKGEVVHGRQIGRTIAAPTANIKVEENLLLPAKGVYAAKVYVGHEVYIGVLNIGQRPTLNNGIDTTVEVHILDFDADIYGEIIEAEVFQFLRGEKRFANLEELKRQIQHDINEVRSMFSGISKQ